MKTIFFVNTVTLKRAAITDMKIAPSIWPRAFSQCPDGCAPVIEHRFVFVCFLFTLVSLCVSVTQSQTSGTTGTCRRAGGRSQTPRRSTSGTFPPAPHSTTDL